ncbi:MAG TPA: sugar ABC transporter permease [Chloroflexia bacterium]|jgi:glucose/mannose transport system permease protein|nr:sugar ABC transporter permease [Chloroflexia bacterium]
MSSNIVTPQAPTQPSAQPGPAPMVIPQRTRRNLTPDRLTAILMLLPSIVAIALFVYGFIAWNGWASLTNWRGLGTMNQVGPIRFPAADFSGLSNYERLFQTPRFLTDLRNNAIFTVVFLVGCVVVGLVLAIMLDRKVRGEGFFRNVFLLPMALSFVVTGTIWRWVFLQLGWVTNPNLALPALIIAAIWQESGFTMAMFLAALRGIPADIREAARVDGATEFRMYRDVILPLINPVVLSALIILGHLSLKIFDLVYVMTGGSPTLGYATDMPSLYLFQLAFGDNLFARAAAVAMIMLLFVAVIIIPYLWTNLRAEVAK